MTIEHPLLTPLRELHEVIVEGVLAASTNQSVDELARVADDGEGDTIYAVDRVSEELLVRELSRCAEDVGGIVLIAEGIAGGELTLPEAWDSSRCRYRVIVDPIDGTRGYMYQKRPAWVLTGVAPNHGPDTHLRDIELSVQSELPLVKQRFRDQLVAVRGQGVNAWRIDVVDAARAALVLRPSRASTLEHAFATFCRFFPGVRDEIAAIDDELMFELMGPPKAKKALCFEDQYTSTGGQFYELMAGHDRFVADLRPLLAPVLERRGLPAPLCCHPYDVSTALIAEELGVCLRSPWGEAFDAPLDVDSDVSWVGYANSELLRRIEPVLMRVLERRGLLRGAP
ncbi:MAG: inositol monophosphatase family protein [Myxococcota bacterium]